MLDAALSQLVAAAVAEAQRPLVSELAAVRWGLAEAQRLGRAQRGRS